MEEYIENYKDVKKQNTNNIRSILRRFALDGLSFWDKVKGIEDNLNNPRIQFLYIHHIFKDEEKNLEKLLERLSINHEFISYSDAVSKILEGKIDKPYICISSDDGFKNNIKAAEIMKGYDVQACFFVNPYIVENQSYEIVKNYCENRLNMTPVEFMNWDDIDRVQKMGHEIGSHTMNHINVANTEKNAFLEDCNNTYEILIKQCGEAKHFAFPYGRFFHFNEQARKIVFNSGFTSCASAERGCHINHNETISKEELCIRRDNTVLDWDINHIFYFIASNSRKANVANNLFPYI